jgi:hypothetical protein
MENFNTGLKWLPQIIGHEYSQYSRREHDFVTYRCQTGSFSAILLFPAKPPVLFSASIITPLLVVSYRQSFQD